MDIKKIKIEEEKVEKSKFSTKCPFIKCEKIITGTSKNQVIYNLQIHLDAKHKEVKDDK